MKIRNKESNSLVDLSFGDVFSLYDANYILLNKHSCPKINQSINSTRLVISKLNVEYSITSKKTSFSVFGFALVLIGYLSQAEKLQT